MEAAVAGGLGVLDVVHLADDLERLEPGQQRAEVVDIVQIVADDADTGQVLYVRVNVVDTYLEAAALQLVHNAVQ